VAGEVSRRVDSSLAMKLNGCQRTFLRNRCPGFETLVKQAANKTKEQFANSPDLKNELVNAIINALDAHNEMSSQALGSEDVQKGLKDILLGPAKLYEALREKTTGASKV
jgi:type I restriction enzyme R subunit